MAIPGYIGTQLAGLGKEAQGILTRVFEYVLGNLKFGAPETGKRALNFQWYCLTATAPATPDTEFSILHGLSSAPYLVLPVLDARVPASSVNVTVTKASDAKRIYLSCSIANAPITVYVEGA